MSETDGSQLYQNEHFLGKAYRAAVVPSVLAILSGCITILVDGVMVGQKLGTDGLAAVNYCVPMYLMLCVAGSLFASGSEICSSQEIGRDHAEEARKFYRGGITACLAVSLILTAVGCLVAGPYSRMLTSDAAVAEMIRGYTFIFMAGAVFTIMVYFPFWFLRLEGKHKAVTVMMILMGVGNVVLDYLFIFTMDLGVHGAALASVLSSAISCVYGFYVLHSKEGFFVLKPYILNRKQWKALFAAGVPAAMNNLLQSVRMFFVNALLSNYGGSALVAQFMAVNGIWAFGEAVTVGVPQAGTSMLGVYYGERDIDSAGILLRKEFQTGMILCAVFDVVIICTSGLITRAYALPESLLPGILCVAVSMFPSLANSIVQSYYSVSRRSLFSEFMIFCRVLGIAVPALAVLLHFGRLSWLFLLISELGTLVIWFVVSGVISRRDQNLTRFFLMDQSLKKSGKVLNFSVQGNNESICTASERVQEFSMDCGVTPRQAMRFGLAIEEMMTLVTAAAGREAIYFDVRIFFLEEVTGLRIRYNGPMYNPLAGDEADEEYMGIQMILKMAEDVLYQKNLGINTVLVLL